MTCIHRGKSAPKLNKIDVMNGYRNGMTINILPIRFLDFITCRLF